MAQKNYKEGEIKKKKTFCVGPVGPTDKENQLKVCKKYRTVLGTLPLWNGKDPDPYPYQTVGSGIRIKLKSRIRIRIKVKSRIRIHKGLDP